MAGLIFYLGHLNFPHISNKAVSLISCVFTVVALFIPSKSFSFAFSTCLFGARGLVFGLSRLLTCFAH